MRFVVTRIDLNLSMLFFKKNILLFILALSLTVPVFVLADQYGIEDAAKGTSLQKVSLTSKYKNNLPGLIGNVATVGLGLVGVVFFLLILYGGIYYMTAMGRTEQAEKAKEILEKAIVGLVIVGASYAIANFVFSSLASKGSAGGKGGNGGCCLELGPNQYFCNAAIDEQTCNNRTDASYVLDCGQC